MMKPWWEKINNLRWQRVDGAVVRWDNRSPYPNPMLASAKMWTAYEPDPSERYLGYYRKNSTFFVQRRWHTPEAAMKAVDREFPFFKD